MGPAGWITALVQSALDGQVAIFAVFRFVVSHSLGALADRQEIDREAHWTDRFHFVLDSGRYCLGRVGAHYHVQFRFGPSNKPQLSTMHVDLPPRFFRDAVSAAKA
jgi:hypothetical protein